MSYRESILNLSKNLISAGEKSTLIKSQGIDQLKQTADSFSEIIEQMDLVYNWYFNDLSIENGEGNNFSKGNNYSNMIEKEYVYPLIRKLLLDHLILFDENKKAVDQLDSSIKTFSNGIDILEDDFLKFKKTYSPPIQSTSSSDSSGETSSPPPSAEESFWSKEGSLRFSQLLNPIISLKNEYVSNSQSLVSLILKWLDLGEKTLNKVFGAIEIYGYKDIMITNDLTLYDQLNKTQNSLGKFSPNFKNNMVCIEKILKENPPKEKQKIEEPKPITLNIKNIKNLSQYTEKPEIKNEDEIPIEERIRLEVFQMENLKEKSELILNQIKTLFNKLHDEK